MKFLCLFHFLDDAFEGLTDDELRHLDDATIEHDRKLRQSGHLLIGSPLVEVGKEVVIDRRRRRRRRQKVVDGPYGESKETIGGVVLMEAADIAEAAALFDDDPIAPFARIAIRALRETDRHSETDALRPELKLG